MTNRNISFIVKDQNPLMLRPTDTVHTACQRMCERSVGAVLVTDAHAHLKGIFTGRDAVQVIANGSDPAKVHLSEVMTAKPDTIEPERKAIDALHMMCDGGYRHLPVVVDGAPHLLAAWQRTPRDTTEAARYQIGVLAAQPDALVVGVPFHPDGAAHENTAMARRFARRLRGRHALPVFEVDERYSTTEAHSRGARDADAAAACIILEQFLRSLP